MTNEELTEEDQQALQELGYGFPQVEEKQNIFGFFKRVIDMNDTTRTANLMQDELGYVRIPVRTNLSLALYAKQMGLTGLGEYFFQESQIISDSSLSREGFLDKLAVTQKREVDSRTRRNNLQQNKGWFNKKQPVEE